jgi:hypothetical protein
MGSPDHAGRLPHGTGICQVHDPDQYGVLAEIEAFGLDLLEVRQLTPEAGSPERGDIC